MSYCLSLPPSLKRGVFLFAAAILTLALSACGKGGGGDSSGDSGQALGRPTLPASIVPTTYRDKTVTDVILTLSYDGDEDFPAQKLVFHLRPAGVVCPATMIEGDQTVQLNSASWGGTRPAGASNQIASFTLNAQSPEGKVSLYADSLIFTSMSTTDDQTTFSGVPSGGQCSRGGAQWLNFQSAGVTCTLTYCTGGL